MGELQKIEKELVNWDHLVVKWATSRKLALFIVAFIVATVALFAKLLDGGHWTDFVKWALGSYMGANALDGVSDAMKGKND